MDLKEISWEGVGWTHLALDRHTYYSEQGNELL